MARIDKETDKHPYYELDAGSPHMQPEDYKKAGVGEFSGTQSYTDMEGEPTTEDQRQQGEIQSKLRGHSEFGQVQVHVVNRNVRLSGVVRHRFERDRADTAAREVSGIGTVHNDIHVQPADEGGGPILTSREPGTNQTGSTQRS